MASIGSTLVFGCDGSAETDRVWRSALNHRWPRSTVDVVAAHTLPPAPLAPVHARFRPRTPMAPRLLRAPSGVLQTRPMTADPGRAVGSEGLR